MSFTRNSRFLLRNKSLLPQRPYSTMKAVVIHGSEARVDSQRQVPELHPERLIVKPMSVALNPTDWRHIRGTRAKDGCIIGCDYAGIIESVGSAVTKGWKPGDRIFGCGHGANLVNPDDGVFAEHASVVGDLQMRIPDGMSFEQAATLGLGCITVGQSLYQKALKLELPDPNKQREPNNIPVLIYGGTSATAALAIQFAKQSGYHVITTCTPEHSDYVKSLGADCVFDYTKPDAGARIRQYTNNKMRHAMDPISIKQTAALCAEALTSDSSLDPVYGTLLPVGSPRSDVRAVSIVMYTVFGEHFKFGPADMPASKEDFEFGKKFYSLTERLVAQGRIRPHAHITREGGLDGVLQGLKDLEDGKVVNGKLVYSLSRRRV